MAAKKAQKAKVPRAKKVKEYVPSSPPELAAQGSCCPHCDTVHSFPIYAAGVEDWQRSRRRGDSNDRWIPCGAWRAVACESPYDCVRSLRNTIESIQADVESLNEWRRR
jgi:hypothetical protein